MSAIGAKADIGHSPPIWASVVYHALSAARDNRWRDWLLAGAFFILAFLAKYLALEQTWRNFRLVSAFGK